MIESWKPGESLSFGRWRWIQAAQSRPPSISAASDYRPRGYGKNATPMATLGSGNAPPHSPDAWQPGMPIRTRSTRMSGASGGVIAFWPRARPSGSAEAIGYCDLSPEAAKIIDRLRAPGPGGDAGSILNRIVSESAARSGIK